MADLHEQGDSAEDINDDGNFKIRIPNPKVYMARQSLWIGRRGKPRCDHCRVNNLKVRLLLVFHQLLFSSSRSVIASYPHVTTALGLLAENASILHCQRPPTGASRGVIVVVSKT